MSEAPMGLGALEGQVALEDKVILEGTASQEKGIILQPSNIVVVYNCPSETCRGEFRNFVDGGVGRFYSCEVCGYCIPHIAPKADEIQ